MLLSYETYEDAMSNCTVDQLLSKLEGYHYYSIMGLYTNEKDISKSYWSMDFYTEEEKKPSELIGFKSANGVSYHQIKNLRVHKWYIKSLDNGSIEIQIFLKENYKYLPIDGVRLK